MRLRGLIWKKYCHVAFQGKGMVTLKGNNENETHKLSGNENGEVEMENNQHDKKTPPEETGQENILDLFRWPLLFKHLVISTLLW